MIIFHFCIILHISTDFNTKTNMNEYNYMRTVAASSLDPLEDEVTGCCWPVSSCCWPSWGWRPHGWCQILENLNKGKNLTNNVIIVYIYNVIFFGYQLCLIND